MDTTRTCADCGHAFIITENEQAFFAAKALALPRRCPSCRRLRRELRAKTPPLTPSVRQLE